jgi:DNA uptake protein ComE-like DNA-binding protein
MNARIHPSRLLLLGSALALAACGADSSSEGGATEADAPATTAEAPAATGLLNPNEADAQALMAVPGMTAELVEALIAARPFQDMLQVDALLAGSLDEAAREEAYRSVFLPLDLNEASEEEILLIPGVGDRMAHEFDEYRPYDAIERFRREIGKYVDEAEVARLEQYVVIR